MKPNMHTGDIWHSVASCLQWPTDPTEPHQSWSQESQQLWEHHLSRLLGPCVWKAHQTQPTYLCALLGLQGLLKAEVQWATGWVRKHSLQTRLCLPFSALNSEHFPQMTCKTRAPVTLPPRDRRLSRRRLEGPQ